MNGRHFSEKQAILFLPFVLTENSLIKILTSVSFISLCGLIISLRNSLDFWEVFHCFSNNKCTKYYQVRSITQYWLLTCQRVNQFRRLHLVQVGSTIPGSCDHLAASDQPVSCDHDPLVTLQGRCSDPNGGDLTKPLAVHLPLFSIRRVLVVIARCLRVNDTQDRAIHSSIHSYTCRNKNSFCVNICYNILWNSP